MANYLSDYEKSKGYPNHLVMPRDLPNHDHDNGRIKTYDPYKINDGMQVLWGMNKPLISDSDGLGSDISADVLSRWYWACFSSGGFTSFLARDLGTYPNGSTISEHLNRVRYLVDFVNRTDYANLKPADNLIVYGKGFCNRKNDSEYIVYLPAGGSITINLSSGSYQAQWFNPRDGQYKDIGIKNGGQQGFSAPDNKDWVLYLKKIITSRIQRRE